MVAVTGQPHRAQAPVAPMRPLRPTPARRTAMRRRETAWLRQLVRAGAALGPLVTPRP